MQRLGPTKKRKRICSECVDCFGQRTVFMCWTESGLCTRDGWIRTDSQRSQFHPTNLFLSLRLWCKDLVPQKGGKGKAVSVLIVLATGLSLCTEQRVDFVQEMGELELTHKGVSFSQQISSLVSSVMQRLGPTKKKWKGYAVSVFIVSATGLSLCTKQRVDFVQEVGD